MEEYAGAAGAAATGAGAAATGAAAAAVAPASPPPYGMAEEEPPTGFLPKGLKNEDDNTRMHMCEKNCERYYEDQLPN